MLFVFEMSTDPDIVATPLHRNWVTPQARYHWDTISRGNLQIPGGSVIIVIAHGHSTEIGNRRPGTVDINATTFCHLVQGNMAWGQVPEAIYISTCEEEIASFAAGVSFLAGNSVWHKTELYGHSQPMRGPVPPPGDKSLDWVRIYSSRQ
jgi:hypothetical protein